MYSPTTMGAGPLGPGPNPNVTSWIFLQGPSNPNHNHVLYCNHECWLVSATQTMYQLLLLRYFTGYNQHFLNFWPLGSLISDFWLVGFMISNFWLSNISRLWECVERYLLTFLNFWSTFESWCHGRTLIHKCNISDFPTFESNFRQLILGPFCIAFLTFINFPATFESLFCKLLPTFFQPVVPRTILNPA